MNELTIDAVLFDVDGTLVDSRNAILETYEHALRHVCGGVADEIWQSVDVEQLLQVPATEAIALLAHGKSELASKMSEVFQRRYAQIEPRIAWFPGAVDVLHALRQQHILLAVVTTKARARLDMHLASAGVTDLFDGTISGDETPLNKPDPAPVVAILDRIETAANRAMLVGDGANDVLAARNAGIRSVGAAYGFHPADCAAAAPDHWITTIAELPELVTGARR